MNSIRDSISAIEAGSAKFKNQLVEDIQQDWESYKLEQGSPNTPTVKMVADFVKSKTEDISDEQIADILTSAGAKSTHLGRTLNRNVAWNAIEELMATAEMKSINPKEGDTIESSGYVLTFSNGMWAGLDPDENKITPKGNMQEKITDIWREKETTKEPTGRTLTDKAEEAGLEPEEVNQKDVVDHIEQEHGATEEQADKTARSVGVDPESEEPIGDALDDLTAVVNDAKKRGDFDGQDPEEAIIDRVREDIGSRYFKEAIIRAREVLQTGNYDELSQLEKYGLAVLLSTKQVRK